MLLWVVSVVFVRVGFDAVNEETGTGRGMGTLPAKRKITLSGQDTYNKIGVHVLTFRDLFCGHFEHAGLLHIKKCTLGGWAWCLDAASPGKRVIIRVLRCFDLYCFHSESFLFIS